MKLRFWGVRGSAAVAGPTTLEFGGNTSCVELEGAGTEVVLFDAGTGIRGAGVYLLARAGGQPLSIHVFLTHFHWDHIQGLPFFAPLYNKAHCITLYASEFSAPLQDSLRGLMTAPYFPISFDSVAATVKLVSLDARGVEIAGVKVTPVEVQHPQGACAYRVEGNGVSCLYAPDREHGDERLDALLAEEARGVTALLVDSQYTPEEYEQKRGWGHSTWLESARLARAAEARSLILFHHDPGHDDAFLRRIETEARTEFPATFLAKEGWSLDLSTSTSGR
jgi:phosphoribosyl 1,2-cyclic phosphodiesterase